MPGWYLILSAVVGLLVLAWVAYGALAQRRHALDAGAGTEFDASYADAPTRREAEELPREPVTRRSEFAEHGR